MEKEIYEFGPFLLDPAERVLSCEGIPISLTPKAFDTLFVLVCNPGHMLTKDELLKQVWPDSFVEEVNLAVNISMIRKALGENPPDYRYIATVPGRGYRFVAEVRNLASHNGAEKDSAAPDSARDKSSDQLETGSRTFTRTFEKRSAFRFVIPMALAFSMVVILGGYYWMGEKGTRASAPSSASIAVLPFADLSPGKDQEYFSDGLTEELTNDLAKAPGIRVVARSSAFQFKNKNEDLRSIAQKLGVANILEGSVSRQGDRVRIMAELVKADDGFQLWSENYDRRMGDIFSVQDEIARAAAKALEVKLGQGSVTGIQATERTSNPAAYDAYLHAGYFSSRGRDKADLQNALAYTEQAIKADPKYASAWALRSYLVDTMTDVGMMSPAEGFPKARADAERAIELDPNGAGGYLALAWAQMNRDWNWDGAELSLNKAAEIAPGSASILRYRSFLSQSLGRLNEAIEFHQQAITLDPLKASSHSYLAYLLYCAGEYKKSEAAMKKALELNPQKTYDHFNRGEILLQQGRAAEALKEMEQEPGAMWSLTGKALVYQALGRKQDSDAALAQLIHDHQQHMAFQIAEIYAYRGEPDKAFEWLDRAREQRDSGLRSVKIDPLLKPLRRDARYAELLKKLNLSA